ncbi:hypothetical protein ACRTEV_12825 [Rossellomorea arthrocnemi]
MGKEKANLSEELKEKDSEFDKKMLKYDKEIEELKKNILSDKE